MNFVVPLGALWGQYYLVKSTNYKTLSLCIFFKSGVTSSLLIPNTNSIILATHRQSVFLL
jgi:hypothetical protein